MSERSINSQSSEDSPLLANEKGSKSIFATCCTHLLENKINICVTVLMMTAVSIAVVVSFYEWYFPPFPPNPDHTPLVNWTQRGMTFTNGKYCPYVRMGEAKAQLSMQNLASTGANMVAIVVTEFQEDINSTTIAPTNLTVTMEELKTIIEFAHEIGLSVMLKPHIDLTYDHLHWRGEIGTHFTDAEWRDWFASYKIFIMKYANLARLMHVEQFSLGCELIATSPRDAEWRMIASSVKKVFNGTITYAANWGGEEVSKTWWDVVDIIGVDAYYILTNETEPSLEKIKAAWEPIIYQGFLPYTHLGLYNLTQKWNKTMIFTEVGYCSGDCTEGPGLDMQYQLNHYEAILQVFKNFTWFEGVHWWNWASDPAFGGQSNWCMTPQFKPAEDLLRSYYGGNVQSVLPTYPAACPCIL